MSEDTAAIIKVVPLFPGPRTQIWPMFAPTLFDVPVNRVFAAGIKVGF